MQNDTQNIETVAATIVPAHVANAPSAKPEASAAQPIVSIATVAAITDAETAKRKALAEKLAAKRQAATVQPATANGKAAAKRVNAKSSKPTVTSAKPAKPTSAAREAAQRQANDDRRLARDVAAKAVSAFYSGRSLPFKPATDRFADINMQNGKASSERQSALMLALITYGAGNMLSDGTFVRGGFIVPAKLINPSAKPGETVRAQPESGCLGNMLGRSCVYLSGPKSGRDQSAAIYRLNLSVALSEIASTFGDKQRNVAAKLLAGFPAKRAA